MGWSWKNNPITRAVSWTEKKVEQVVAAPVQIINKAAEEIKQAVNFTTDKIVEPVLNATVKTVEQIASDPKTLAMVALSIAAPGAGTAIGSALGLSGTTAAIVGNTVINTAFNGGNLEQGLKSALVPVVGGAVAGEVATKLATSGMNQVIAATVGNVAGSVAVSSLTGQSVKDAATMGVVASVPMALNSNDTFKALPAPVKTSVIAGVQAELQGKDVNAAMITGAVYGANIVGTLIDKSPVLRAAINDSRAAASFEKLTSSVVNASLAAAAQGKSQKEIDAIAERTLIATSQKLLTSPEIKRSVDKQKLEQQQNRQGEFKEITAAFSIGQLSQYDKASIEAIEKQYITDENMSLEDALNRVKSEVFDSVATEDDIQRANIQYLDWKKYYTGDITDEDLRIAAESAILSEKGYGDEVTIDMLARRNIDAETAADEAAREGLSYEAQRDIREKILAQDVYDYSDPNYNYERDKLLQDARYAAAMSLEYAKAEAVTGTPEEYTEIVSNWLMEQETKDAKLWIQDQVNTSKMIKDQDGVADILKKLDSREYNAAEAYDAFKAVEEKSVQNQIQLGDKQIQQAYNDALEHATENGLTDPEMAKQWATDVALGLKNYQDFETVKSLPVLADNLKNEARTQYGLSDSDANNIAARFLSGELNYNDALNVTKNVAMSRELGYTDSNLAFDAPTLFDKGADLELKALNFERTYGIDPSTQEEIDALAVARNDIRNSVDPITVYNTFMAGGYNGAKLAYTPVEIGQDGVNTPVADYSSYYMPPVDYSLGTQLTPKPGVDPETGTGLELPSALTNVTDLTGWMGETPIDYGLINSSTPTSGLGLTLPKSPAIKDMGGATGLTAGVTNPLTGETGVIGELGYTPEGASPVLGDPKSFINNPEVLGTPVLKVDPDYLEPLSVAKTPTAPTFNVSTQSGWMKTRTNLPTGSSAAATPAGASDGTEATPTWKSPMLTPGGLTSTYDPNQDYTFQSLNAPQPMDISTYTPLQQLNPALQQPAPVPEIPAAVTPSPSGYYNYGVEKSPFSFDSSPFYANASPQFAQLKGGGPVMASPLMAAGGVPHKGSHYVQGEGGGQDDLIEARLADGEYVFDADIVSALGDGSNKEGAKKLDAMREAIRKHKRAASVKTIPPKAKSPLAYLKLGAK